MVSSAGEKVGVVPAGKRQSGEHACLKAGGENPAGISAGRGATTKFVCNLCGGYYATSSFFSKFPNQLELLDFKRIVVAIVV